MTNASHMYLQVKTKLKSNDKCIPRVFTSTNVLASFKHNFNLLKKFHGYTKINHNAFNVPLLDETQAVIVCI